jgi:hypothetical protein
MRPLRRFFLATVLIALVGGCGENSKPTDPNDSAPEASDLECNNPALGAASALPFDLVEVTGIEGIGEATWVRYVTPAGVEGLTAVLVDDQGRADIVVPPNPDDLMNGGTLLLTVTDGIASCTALEIEVLPVEPVTGDPLADVAAAFDQLLAALAGQLGLDPDTVASTSLDQLPPQAIPLALLLEAREAFDPASALSELTADEAAFAQAMTARFGLAAILADVSESVGGLTKMAGKQVGAAPFLNSAWTDDCGDLGTVPEDLFGLNDPQTLSGYIQAARGASDSLGPLSQNISDTGTAFAVLGLVSPPVGAIAGWMAFSANLVQQMRANLYPSAISRLEYQLDKDRIEEDWYADNGDPPIKWSFAKIWATNNGMGLARVGLDFMTTAVALPSGFAGAVGDAAIGGLDIAGKEALNARLDELQNDPDGNAECWGIGATEFGPVVIDDDTGSQWVTAEVVSGEAIEIDFVDIREIAAKKIGTATLRVKTQSEPFPGPFGFEDKTVEVLRKEVAWLPQTLLVDNPGQPVTIKFRVDNSKHNGPEDIELMPGPHLEGLPEPTFANGLHTLTFTTSADPADYPTYIDVCSTSRELPPETPERCARIDIIANEQLRIEQKEVCVGPGEREPFTATASGPGNVVVHWEIESGAGSLSSTTGLTIDYIAPNSGSGEVTLRAYLESNNEIEDRITFRYGQCSGLAVYYGNLVEINFPFGTGEPCNNPDLDDSFEEVNFPEDGLLPLESPAPGDIWVGRTETFTHHLFDDGVFGDLPPDSQDCVYGSFGADASFTGTLTGSADGTRLDIDIVTDASSNCQDLGTDIGNECSTATASMSIAARFDFDISAAADFRLEIELEGDSYAIPGYPPLSGMVSVIILQVEPNGNMVPTNPTTQPIQTLVNAENPLSVNRLIQFQAPAAEGQVDHIMVVFMVDNTSIGGFGTDSGEISRDGYIQGYISVTQE